MCLSYSILSKILWESTTLLYHPYLTSIKTHYTHLFWKSQWHFFLGESSIIALYSNLLGKLSKSEMKNWNLHSNLSNPKKITKRINVQFKVDFTKDGTSNVTIQIAPKIYHHGFIFLLMELETKPITFCHHTLKYHNT
jgi:hypothetical protein